MTNVAQPTAARSGDSTTQVPSGNWTVDGHGPVGGCYREDAKGEMNFYKTFEARLTLFLAVYAGARERNQLIMGFAFLGALDGQ